MKKKVKGPKKFAYVFASVILGILVSLVAHSLIEIAYINWLLSHGLVAEFFGRCTLPWLLQVSLMVFGSVSGLHLGLNWWKSISTKKS